MSLSDCCILGKIYIWITCDLFMNHMWFGNKSHVIFLNHIWFTKCNFTTCIFIHCNTKSARTSNNYSMLEHQTKRYSTKNRWIKINMRLFQKFNRNMKNPSLNKVLWIWRTCCLCVLVSLLSIVSTFLTRLSSSLKFYFSSTFSTCFFHTTFVSSPLRIVHLSTFKLFPKAIFASFAIYFGF